MTLSRHNIFAAHCTDFLAAFWNMKTIIYLTSKNTSNNQIPQVEKFRTNLHHSVSRTILKSTRFLFEKIVREYLKSILVSDWHIFFTLANNCYNPWGLIYSSNPFPVWHSVDGKKFYATVKPREEKRSLKKKYSTLIRLLFIFSLVRYLYKPGG